MIDFKSYSETQIEAWTFVLDKLEMIEQKINAIENWITDTSKTYTRTVIISESKQRKQEIKECYLEYHRALRNGIINRPKKCDRCQSESDKIEGHHLNHSRPLDVIWLCKTCHGLTRKK